MAFSLTNLRKQQESQWFHFVPDGLGGLERSTNEEDQARIVASFNLKYLSQREIRKLADSGLSRRAITKQGFKALLASEDEFRVKVTRACLIGWKLTVAGANLLGLERVVEGVDPKLEIDFTDENLDVMIRESTLSAFIHSLATDHSAWFGIVDAETGKVVDEEEIDEGNSGRGPSGSSAEQPAGTASQGT